MQICTAFYIVFNISYFDLDISGFEFASSRQCNGAVVTGPPCIFHWSQETHADAKHALVLIIPCLISIVHSSSHDASQYVLNITGAQCLYSAKLAIFTVKSSYQLLASVHQS